MDLVEQYGLHSGLFKYPNKNLSGLIASKCIHSMLHENVKDLNFYLRFSRGEPVTLKLVLVLTLVKVYKTKLGKKVVPKFISKFKSK